MSGPELPAGAPPPPPAGHRTPQVPADDSRDARGARSWLWRQRWWLLALVVVIPAVVLAALGPRWWEYRQNTDGDLLFTQIGQPVDYAGALWRLDEVVILDRSDAEAGGVTVPSGAELVVAVVDVTPAASGSSLCTLEFVDPAQDRRWRNEWNRVDLAGTADAASGCEEERVGQYRFVVSWIVPAGVGASGQIELSVLDAEPLRIRFVP